MKRKKNKLNTIMLNRIKNNLRLIFEEYTLICCSFIQLSNDSLVKLYFILYMNITNNIYYTIIIIKKIL